jgi:hypothetical protein
MEGAEGRVLPRCIDERSAATSHDPALRELCGSMRGRGT